MPDLPASSTTTAVVTVGGQYSDILETAADHDWIKVTLAAGQTVEIRVLGFGGQQLTDSTMALYDPASVVLFTNDDYGVYGDSFNSGMIWTAQTAGTYFIDVGGFDNIEVGGYQVSVATAVQPPPLASLDWGTQVSDTSIDVYFAPAGVGFGAETSEGFNAYEIARFQAAFDLISAVAGVTFNIVASAAAADFRLVLDTNENNGEYLGYFSPPGTTDAGVGVFAGDAWDRTAGGSLEAGGYDFVTITHELLHGLGLAHPHDNGGSSTVMEGVQSDFDDYGAFNLNQGIFTTMSYNTGFHTGASGSAGDPNNQWGYESGPMALDIAILQQKYGANTTTNTGNNSYQLVQANADGAMWRAIWDAGGSDEIRNTGAAACTIDLRSANLRTAAGGGGFVSSVIGISGGFTIAAGAVIENAFGGSGADKLIGNSGANLLDGGAGADTLIGLAGNDTYIVDNSSDIVDEIANRGTADRVLARSNFVLSADDDIECLQTISTSSNTSINLTGNALAQQLFGNSGINTLDGGAGAADTLTGSGGNDTYIIRNAGTVIVEGIGQGTADRVLAATGFILATDDNIEVMQTVSAAASTAINLTGNALAQSFFGNAGANQIDGREGQDTLTGNGGADRFVFSTALAPSNVDFIIDFVAGLDEILLGGAVFAGIGAGALATTRFHAGASGQATSADVRIIYETDNGNLWYDADGNGAGVRVLFGDLAAGLGMTFNDFTVF